MAATAAFLSSTQISTNYHHFSSSFDASRRRETRFNLRKRIPNMQKTSSFDRKSLAQASSKFQSQIKEEEEVGAAATKSPNEKPPFISQEDLNYVVKLGIGSVAGAAAIKYGSIIFPEITRPNIAQAIVMISAPVLLAVLLLIIQSRATPNQDFEI